MLVILARSILGDERQHISTNQERFYGCSILEADRELVESNADEILPKDEKENVAFLVVGDPFGATTHSDLILRARAKNIKVKDKKNDFDKINKRKITIFDRYIKRQYPSFVSQVKVIHNCSILTAIGCSGLQLYRFGETVSIPCWSMDWQPNSFYDKIISNKRRDLHTLCLLDIKIKEPTIESISKKKKEYMPTRFMSVSEAATQLLKIMEEKMKENKEEMGKR